MGVNKVIYGGNTLIDISDKTVTPETLFEGETAKNAAGDDIVGTFTIAAEMTVQDSLIAQIKSALKGKVSGGGGVTTISGVDLHDKSTDIPNTYISGATIKDYNGWTTTDYIQVEEGKYYLAYSTSAIDAKYCSNFNSSKGYKSSMSGVVNCTNKNKPAFIVGFDGFVRFSGRTEQINVLEFYEVINFNWEV